MKSIKKIICAFDILIFFFISCVFYSNPLFCLGPFSLFQEKETEQYSEVSFLKSLKFLNDFLDNVIPKHEKSGLFNYWKEVTKELTVGQNNVFDPALDKEMIILVQELKKYEYHFFQCFRQILNYALLKIKENSSVCIEVDIPDYFHFNINDYFSQQMTVQEFMKETTACFIFRYSLILSKYQKIFSETTMFFFLSCDKIISDLGCASAEMINSSTNIDYWQKTFNRFLLVIDQMQKNLNTESYCHKLFKSLNIPIDPKNIKNFSKHEGVLFNSKQAIYPSIKKEEKMYFVLSQEISQMFSLLKKGMKILLNRINTKNKLDIRYINTNEELISLLKTLKDPTHYPFKKKYTIGIILNYCNHKSNYPFLVHTIPLIVNKKENKEIEIYSFDSLGHDCFEEIIASGIIESNKLHASISKIQRTVYGCQLYCIYFLVMALKDMETNSFDPQDIITLINSDTFHFPFRWASVCQRTRDIKQENSQQPLNQQVVFMKSHGDLKYVTATEFIKKHINQHSLSIPFVCEENEKTQIKEIFHRDILEKQASVFFIQNMIDALKNQKQTLENLNEDSTIHLTSSA